MDIVYEDHRVSQTFWNILQNACLQHVYHVTEPVQAMVGTLCGWCADTLCLSSLDLWFENHTMNVQYSLIREVVFNEL